MNQMTPPPRGLWLPLITPFRDGALDEASLRRLTRHYAALPVDGFILAATTGEGLTLDDDEIHRLVMIFREETQAAGQNRPVFLGLSGVDTRKMIRNLARVNQWPVDGYLIACPYYVRPSQDGLSQHFTALANHTERPILVYNIPYRTGVNMTNDTLLQLAALPNIIGVKDCSADPAQSAALLQARPAGFSVLTGEDASYYDALALGAEGGILGAAHIATAAFAALRPAVMAGDRARAAAIWRDIAALPSLLFAEPSPAPIKYWLWRAGLIDSPELRLPMTPISPSLAERLDQAMARLGA